MKNKLFDLRNAVYDFLESLNELQIRQIERLAISDDPNEIAAIRYQMMMSSIITSD